MAITFSGGIGEGKEDPRLIIVHQQFTSFIRLYSGNLSDALGLAIRRYMMELFTDN